MTDPHPTLQHLSDTYQKLQTDLQSSISARQRLESQQQENKSVQKEFALLPPPSTAQIYKLVGPVLLKQERSEAVLAVGGRLDFIEREIRRLEAKIEETQGESERVKGEVYRLQVEVQGGQ